ncbi:replication-relaxation family protein [Agrobacterium tumefaciens]|uniref:Protein involved in plasmid replication-relaxation n=2 Tax=Agrobacterium tumefaciens TaxID=358 RepID=A0AA44JAA3_AGRTU|nr:hypothetical protein [Agrobacterium tumefaciens]NTC29397.1 hypothetical protein [Agrobacterium tumefaciens]
MTSISSPVAMRILRHLGRYKFLSISQLVQLRASDEKSVRTRLGDLLTAKMIDRQEFRLGPSAGRLPNIHWLTSKGAEFLEEMEGAAVSGTRSREVTAPHSWHRMLMVDTIMAADRWAETSGQSPLAFSTYMQRQGRTSPTSLKLGDKNAEADGIFRLTDTAGHQRVYVVEVYCSNYSEGRSTFSVTQLEHYISSGGEAFDDQLGLPKGGKAARVLVVCDTPQLRDRLLRTLPKREGMPPLDRMTWQRLHFKAADELGDFGEGWHRIGGAKVGLPV